ncbi:MAG: PQQ-dependent sugar dehydrogenase [Flavobacteriaceae bacterium]
MKKIILISFLAIGFVSLAQTITLTPFATGFSDPVEIAHCGDDRLFVVEQGGAIKVVNSDGSVNAENFLDLSSLISTGSERGLLGLAFHPDYESYGYFFVNYTNTSGNTVIARYKVSNSDPNVADLSSGHIILTINQPFSNHNGGCIKIGPDGHLWISMGDGGSGGDPNNNGQNKNSLLGKMLRIAVNGDFVPYSIPADNPFADGVEGEAEIWAYGLRNAWKFSFDKETHELWIADVGQNAIEEINKTSSTEAGLNYGWRCYEGNSPYNTSGCEEASTMIFPEAHYNHSSGRCSITGGYVYRGSQYSDIYGLYFFADYCSNQIGVVDENGSLTFLDSYSGNFFSTFGEDASGELYIAGKGSGTVHKIHGSVPASITDIENSIKVFPNPANDFLFVESTSNAMISEMVLYDILGKEILRKSFGTTSATLDVSGVSNGLYILKIGSSDGKISSHKIRIE